MPSVKSAEVKLNYYALTVSILAVCGVEMAFEKLESPHPDSVHLQLSEDDVRNIFNLRLEGMSWEDIASFYDVPGPTILAGLKLHTRKKRASEWVNRSSVICAPRASKRM